MSQTLAPPPAPARPSRRRRRPWLSEKPETRAIQIGVLGTILIHLILLLLAPNIFRLDQVRSLGRPHVTPHPFNIEMSPDSYISAKPPPKPPPPKFVETNPNAPENTPDKTSNFSNRNQQVAQEKPTPHGKSDHPALAGRKDVQSTQIVTGQLSKPQVSVPVPPKAAPPKPAAAAAPKLEQNPLAGFEKQKGESPDGFASNIAKPADNSKSVDVKTPGLKDAPLIQNPQAFAPPQIDPKHPQPRRTLDQHVRPAIFSENKFGTQNIGPTAVDARWSNYGVYLQRMIETVQIEWDRTLAASKIYPNSGSAVSVKFVMNTKGDIARIVSVEPTAGTSDAATRACISAITNRAPYGEWTDDMIAMLGNEQEMTFTFYYQ